MKARSVLLVLLVLPGLGVGLFGQSSPDAAKRADVVRLLQMTGAAKSAVQAIDLMLPMIKQAMPGVPDEVWKQFRSEIHEQDLIDLTYPIWDKHFTHDEIRELIRFYQSPVGQKILRETPAIQQESLVAGQKWSNALVDRILARLREKGYQIPPSLQQ